MKYLGNKRDMENTLHPLSRQEIINIVRTQC